MNHSTVYCLAVSEVVYEHDVITSLQERRKTEDLQLLHAPDTERQLTL